MAKAATNLGNLIKKIYDILYPLEDGERTKVLNSVHQLFGLSAPPAHDGTGAHHNPPGLGQTPRQHDGQSTPQKFFAQKSPQNKGEMLAVAARYRELHGNADHHQADDFAAFFRDARQNFDRRNFTRDMKNAQRQAGLFNVGGQRGQYQLAYYGQQYVDALPDRDAVKKLRRPGRKKVRKKKGG